MQVAAAVYRLATAKHAGSCVAVRLAGPAGQVAIVTAAHNLDGTTARLRIPNGGLPVPPGDWRVLSEHDLAVAPVSAAAAKRLEDEGVCELAGEAPALYETVHVAGWPDSIGRHCVRVLDTGRYQGTYGAKKQALYSGYTEEGSSGGGVFDTQGGLVGIVLASPVYGERASDRFFWSPRFALLRRAINEVAGE